VLTIENPKVIYREVQRPRQFWWWAVVLLVAFLMWYGFIQQIIFGIPFGDKPAPDMMMMIIWVIFGIIFPVVMLGMVKLIIEVRDDGLYIRFSPFHIKFRKFLFKDITHYQVITYDSFTRFGGWGIRLNFNGETAYNVNEKQGLEIKLSFQTIVIGTQQPDELKQALDTVNKLQI